MHYSQNDPLSPVYSKALSSSQCQVLPGNHFRRSENQVTNFLTATPLLSTEFLISVFNRCDQILDKKQLKRRLMLVRRSKQCSPSRQSGCWWGSLVHGDDQGEENGTRQCCSCFSLFAFLSSAKSQPIEFRVSFPSSFMSQAKPLHGPTGISDD